METEPPETPESLRAQAEKMDEAAAGAASLGELSAYETEAAEIRARAKELERAEQPICTCGHTEGYHVFGKVCAKGGCKCQEYTERAICKCGHPSSSHGITGEAWCNMDGCACSLFMATPSREQPSETVPLCRTCGNRYESCNCPVWDEPPCAEPTAEQAGKPTAGEYTVERSDLGYFVFQPTDGGMRIKVAEAFEKSVADFIAEAGTVYHETQKTPRELAVLCAEWEKRATDRIGDIARLKSELAASLYQAGELMVAECEALNQVARLENERDELISALEKITDAAESLEVEDDGGAFYIVRSEARAALANARKDAKP